MSRRNCEWSLHYSNFRGEFIFFLPQNGKMGTNSVHLIDAVHTAFSKITPLSVFMGLLPHSWWRRIGRSFPFALWSYFRHKLLRGCHIRQSTVTQDARKNCSGGSMSPNEGNCPIHPGHIPLRCAPKTYFKNHEIWSSYYHSNLPKRVLCFSLRVTPSTWCYFCMTSAPMHDTRVIVSPAVQIFMKWFISTWRALTPPWCIGAKCVPERKKGTGSTGVLCSRPQVQTRLGQTNSSPPLNHPPDSLARLQKSQPLR